MEYRADYDLRYRISQMGIHKDDEPIETVWVTRAEYEAKFGRKPSKNAVGVMVRASDGTPIVQLLFATPEDEVATLEMIYGLD